MPTDTKPRDHLVRALYADLIGPYQLDEDGIAERLGGVDQCVLGGAFTVCRRVSAITIDPWGTPAANARDWMGVGP